MNYSTPQITCELAFHEGLMHLIGIFETVFEGLLEECAMDAPAARQLITQKLERLFFDLACVVQPDCSLEIGAHGAEFSQRARKLFPDAEVVAVEANPDIFNKNKDFLKRAGVNYIDAAITQRDGTIDFSVPRWDAHGTMGSIRDIPDEFTSRKFTVRAIPLDNIPGVEARKRLVMWVDVEGAAIDVLMSGQNSLPRTELLYVEAETNPRWRADGLLEDIIEYLDKFDLVPVMADVYRLNWQKNVIFMRRGALSDACVSKFVGHFLLETIRSLSLGKVEALLKQLDKRLS